MRIVTVGLNHRTAPVDIRERLAFPDGRLGEALRLLREQTPLMEGVILSTCNRVEIYGVVEAVDGTVGRITEFLGRYHAVPREAFAERLYVYEEPESIRHLFHVASGLDSMVVGESEILGQVKGAYAAAHRERATGKVLNALFQRSFQAAKHVRTDTAIGAGWTSIGSVAVELASRIFEDLPTKRAMIIGAGAMGEVTLQHLQHRGVRSTFVSSRHWDRAVAAAARVGGEAIRFGELAAHLPQVDIVISCTAAPRTVIHRAEVLAGMPERHGRPLFLIDLAVPRDIDPSVNELENVYLYDIDDLTKVADTTRADRARQAERATVMIQRRVEAFMQWFRALPGRGEATVVPSGR